MRLKGRRTIALIVVATLLLIGSVSGIVIAGAEDRSGPYWWEQPIGCRLTPYEHRLLVDILTLILDRYFGTDISRMSQEEMDELGRSIGPEEQERVHRLFEYYAQKKGLELPEPVPSEPPVDPPVEDVYWWEIVGYPEGKINAIMRQIAEAKGISPEEAKERFEEFFPGVDLWRMTFEEFHEFLNSLPQPPLTLVCFEEMARAPNVIALFGRIPSFATEEEKRDFQNKLEKIGYHVSPLLRNKFSHDDFPLLVVSPYRGVIRLVVLEDYLPRGYLPRAQEIYKVIAQKAESLFAIKDVPVIFKPGRIELDIPQASQSTSGWRAPFNEPFCPIPGGVKVTPRRRPGDYSTASFAVRRFRWWRPDDWWDEDYINC